MWGTFLNRPSVYVRWTAPNDPPCETTPLGISGLGLWCGLVWAAYAVAGTLPNSRECLQLFAGVTTSRYEGIPLLEYVMGYSSKIPVKSMWYSNSDLVGELVSLCRNTRPDARAG